MPDISREEFLAFLGEALMYNEAPFVMDKPFPELVFDSTGKLMLAAALEDRYGLQVSVDDLIPCKTPGDVYGLLQQRG
jgi:acyl carrier protein